MAEVPLDAHGIPVCLPQFDPNPDIRAEGLGLAANEYVLFQNAFGLNPNQQNLVNIVNIPPMLLNIPQKERRSWKHTIRFYLQNFFYWLYEYIFGYGRWTIAKMVHHLRNSWVLSEPQGCRVWREEAVGTDHIPTDRQRRQADYWFAWQRLNGVTRNLIATMNFQNIQLEEDFRNKFLNLDIENHPYLNGQLNQLQNVYAVDLRIIGETALPTVAPVTPLSPIALFVINQGKLMPVAIQLTRNGQVYTPAPAGYADWVTAKMWFNMVEAHYHETITHFGFTHLLMDGVSVSMHRTLSERHPIYKLLHPHFRYMHVINSEALHSLLNQGGFVDRDMFFGHVHMLRLLSTVNGDQNRNYDFDANIGQSITRRGVQDIPDYFFKDDATSLRNVIRNFVNGYTRSHYQEADLNVVKDAEIQAFRNLLILGRNRNGHGGCGMKGIPEFNTITSLVEVLTNFIYICSVEHSATNFPQYDQYAFPPNFAAKLQNVPKTQDTLNYMMPTKQEMFSTIKVMKVLSLRLTNRLGHYEQIYLDAMDDAGRDSVKGFQKALNATTSQIKRRNNLLIENNLRNPLQVQAYPYVWLLPPNVLNSISI